MKTQFVSADQIKSNDKNPRQISNAAFHSLCRSVKDFPQMAEARPIVVNKDMMILGGNMRYRAMVKNGWEKIPIIQVDWDEDKQREFIIKDNVSGGEWDWEELVNAWDTDLLSDWGVDVIPNLDEVKATKDIPDVGEIEFSEELLLEHNYVVLYFDNPFDWEVAQEKFGLKMVKDLIPRKGQPTGIGRVINGKPFINGD